MPTKDEKLLGTETPFDQVARMGNTWHSPEQLEKQLLLPVHMLALKKDGSPVVGEVDRDGEPRPGYHTVCGLPLGGEGSTNRSKNRGEGTLRSTDDPDDVTCKACKA